LEKSKLTSVQRHDFHMPDGPEQEKRDEIFRAQLDKNGEIEGAFPSRWCVYFFLHPLSISIELRALISNRTCPEVQPWLYGYDAVKEVEEAVARNPGLFVTPNL
jgi:salicylate hydroxylase